MKTIKFLTSFLIAFVLAISISTFAIAQRSDQSVGKSATSQVKTEKSIEIFLPQSQSLTNADYKIVSKTLTSESVSLRDIPFSKAKTEIRRFTNNDSSNPFIESRLTTNFSPPPDSMDASFGSNSFDLSLIHI